MAFNPRRISRKSRRHAPISCVSHFTIRLCISSGGRLDLIKRNKFCLKTALVRDLRRLQPKKHIKNDVGRALHNNVINTSSHSPYQIISCRSRSSSTRFKEGAKSESEIEMVDAMTLITLENVHIFLFFIPSSYSLEMLTMMMIDDPLNKHTTTTDVTKIITQRAHIWECRTKTAPMSNI